MALLTINTATDERECFQQVNWKLAIEKQDPNELELALAQAIRRLVYLHCTHEGLQPGDVTSIVLTMTRDEF